MTKGRPLTARRREIMKRSAELRMKIGFTGHRSEEDPSVQTSPSTFSCLYESPDGRFCLFEDAQGHLSAVNAVRLM